MNRLTSRLFGRQPTSFVGIQVQDNGNPFTSRLYQEEKPALSFWSDEDRGYNDAEDSCGTQLLSPNLGFSDLFELFELAQDRDALRVFALNIWASRRATRALEDSLRNARERLNQLKVPQHSFGKILVDTRIVILRDHRDILKRTIKKINDNIQQLKIAIFDNETALQTAQKEQKLRGATTQKDWKSETKVLTYHLRRLRSEAEEILQTNQCFIEDCLFDLQIELNNAQLLESRKSIEQNASSKRLQILAFIFIPISTVASIFGMNVDGFSGIDVWKFVVATVSVLVFSLLLAASSSIRALYSALEAAAFAYTTWPTSQTVEYDTRRRSCYRTLMSGILNWQRTFGYVIPLISRLCVSVFALAAFVSTPFEMFWYKLLCWIDYGWKQEERHKVRRLRIANRDARELVSESVSHWLEHTRKLAWGKKIFSYILFPLMFFWAYIVYRVDPSP